MIQTLTPLLLIVTSVFMYVSLIKPWYEETKLILNEVGEYNLASTNYVKYVETLNLKKAQISSLTPRQQDRLDQLLPSKGNDVDILVDLESISEKENMLFGNISVIENDRSIDQSVQSLGLVELDISFEVIGTYAQFKSLLTKLESSLSLFEITSVSFDGTSKANDLMQFAITVRTYSVK